MTKLVSAFSFTAITLGVLLHAGAAEATPTTAPRTWVSGAGSDANPCTRALACATFARAYLVTSPGGEIDVLDGGDFGPLTISQALTVSNDGAGTAGITLNLYSILIAAGPNDAVVLRGLSLNGQTSNQPGIIFATGGSLLVDHCNIQGFQSIPAVKFQPQAASKLWMTDTVLSNDGPVWIVPDVGAATAHLERVQILNATGNGIRVDGTGIGGGGGAADVELRDVTVDAASGGSGIVAVSTTSGGPTIKLVADNVTSSHNAGYGFRAVGGTASVYLSRSVSEDNGVGVGESTGGVVYSYGDNRFANNASDGVTPTPIGLK